MNSPVTWWNQAGSGLLNPAANAFVQSSILILILALVDLAFRRRLRPAWRHALWLLVPIKLLLPPGLALPTGLGYWLPRPAPTASEEFRRFTTEFPPEEARLYVLPSGPAPATASPHEVGWVALEPPGLILLVWVAGTAVLLVRLARSTRVTHRLQAHADDAPEHLVALLEEARRAHGPGRPIALRLVDHLPSPMLCGLREARILLPRRLAETLTPDQLRAVFLHELAHARRGDLWINAGFCLLQAAWWWHPLVWFAHTRLRSAREEAVDAAVAYELGPVAEIYPTTLLEIARTSLAGQVPGLGMLGLLGILETRSLLRARIERLLELPPGQPPGLDGASRLALLGIALVALPMARGGLPERPTVAAPSITAQGTSTPPTQVEEYVKTTPPGDEVSRMADAATGASTAAAWTGDESGLRVQGFRIHWPSLIEALEQRTGHPLGDDGRTWVTALRGQLEAAGIHFDPPKAITLSPKRDDFVVRATTNELRLVAQVLGELSLRPPQIQLEAHFLKVPPERIASLGLRDASRSNGVLTEAQARETLRRAGQGDAPIQRLGGMRLTTLSGRRGIITENENPTNQSPSLRVDALPWVLKDGQTVRLELGADFTEFVDLQSVPVPGQEPTTTGAADDGRTFAANALGYITRHFTNTVEIPDGGSVVLGDVLDPEAAKRTSGPGQTPVAILVTATLIDPAGNAIHPVRTPPAARP